MVDGALMPWAATTTTPPEFRDRRSIRRRDRKVVEVDVAVGLRPQPDAAADGLWEHMLQVELAVEIARDLGARDLHLEVVPLAGRGRRVADPFDRGAFALLELP